MNRFWKNIFKKSHPDHFRKIISSILPKGTPFNIVKKNDDNIIITIEVTNKDHAQNLSQHESDLKEKLKKELSIQSVQFIYEAQRAQTDHAQTDQAHKPPPSNLAPQKSIDNVKNIIMIASGKGGVGKSTVTANLARALKDQGLNVGICDADIYGPSQHKIMGLDGQKPESQNNQIFPPISSEGIKTMSIGFMVAPESALVWRGPMIQKALMQILFDVKWASSNAPLDYLLIDMPPGTGDIQITLSQKVKINGAIIVSTPQDIALIDARKAIDMFRKVGIPITGIIENMSTHICSHCGHEDDIFGAGGAEEEAIKQSVSFLGKIPLSRSIREQCDTGKIKNKELNIYKNIAAELLK